MIDWNEIENAFISYPELQKKRKENTAIQTKRKESTTILPWKKKSQMTNFSTWPALDLHNTEQGNKAWANTHACQITKHLERNTLP